MTDSDAVLSLEPEDLDGHTIDELTDYLEAGRLPADPSIDGSPACRRALAALERLHLLAGEYLDDEDDAVDRAPGRDWIGAVIAAIPIDARAGRRFPLEVDDPRVSAEVTEGAVRGLVRAIGDEVPGLLVGSVRLQVEETPSLSIDVAVAYGTELASATDEFRQALRLVLPAHLPFALERIDIRVIGLIPGAGPAGGGVR